MNIIIKPIITEKSASRFKDGIYLLSVSKDASKTQIKDEVKALYGLDVLSVNTIKLPAKQVKFRRQKGRRSVRYRAVVKLKKGQVFPGIDIPKQEKKTENVKEDK